MKTLLDLLRCSSPFFKSIALIELIIFSVFGSILAILPITLILFFYSLKIKKESEYIVSPWLIFIFCALATIIVFPGGTVEEIFSAAEISVRIALFMLSANLFVIVSSASDFIETWQRLHLPILTLYPFLISARFIPISILNMRSVLLAQKSRGFSFKFRNLFLLETWMIVIIPYLITLLRIAHNNWISMNLRKFSYKSLYIDKSKKILSPTELVIIIGIFALYFIPELNFNWKSLM